MEITFPMTDNNQNQHTKNDIILQHQLYSSIATPISNPECLCINCTQKHKVHTANHLTINETCSQTVKYTSRRT
ncbi:14079_t:CDS:1, partial [Funneliformis caledonium]